MPEPRFASLPWLGLGPVTSFHDAELTHVWTRGVAGKLIVNDARSSNATDGVWSFRRLIENMAPSSGATDTDAFLRGIFESFNSVQTVNGAVTRSPQLGIDHGPLYDPGHVAAPVQLGERAVQADRRRQPPRSAHGYVGGRGSHDLRPHECQRPE